MKEVLLIIDPQNDFVDPKGSLYIPEAEKAIENLCEVIKTRNPSRIIITQDTHQAYHIGHSSWWKEDPAPFTKITLSEIEEGKYSPRRYRDKGLRDYMTKLPNKTHTIWPEHCLEGSWGWAFPDNLIKSLSKWQRKNFGKNYEIVQKGTDPNHEMYSAITRIDKSGTGLKYSSLIKTLSFYDKVLVCGFAKDVCVAWTIKDLLASGMFKDKLVFLNSCMTALDDSAEILNIYKDCVDNYGSVWE